MLQSGNGGESGGEIPDYVAFHIPHAPGDFLTRSEAYGAGSRDPNSGRAGWYGRVYRAVRRRGGTAGSVRRCGGAAARARVSLGRRDGNAR